MPFLSAHCLIWLSLHESRRASLRLCWAAEAEDDAEAAASLHVQAGQTRVAADRGDELVAGAWLWDRDATLVKEFF